MRRGIVTALAVLALVGVFGVSNTYAESRNGSSAPTTVLRGNLPPGTYCIPLSTGGDGCVTPDGSIYSCPSMGDDSVCTLSTVALTPPTRTPTTKWQHIAAPTTGRLTAR
ncbi:MAG: hypothetical protein IT305_27680 [Chloroflexi bacterium]|nr:hypothetical protein [Chloroflexota bacterium]